jgi:hypothetical protein
MKLDKQKTEEILEKYVKINKIPSEYLNDREFMMYGLKRFGAIELCGWRYEQLPEYLQKDVEVIKCFIKFHLFRIKDLPNTLSTKELKEVCFSILVGDRREIKDAPECVRDDETIIEFCLEEYPELIKYASKRLQDNEEIALKALTYQGTLGSYVVSERAPLRYLSDRLRAKKEIVLQSVNQNYYNFQFAGFNISQDRQTVLEIVQRNGMCYALYHDFKEDEEICMEAVKQNGLVFEHLPQKFKLLKEFAVEAVNSNGYAWIYIGEFKKDLEISKLAVTRTPSIIYNYGFPYSEDKEFVLLAVSSDGEMIGEVIYDFRKDHDVMKAAVKQNGMSLRFGSNEIKSNREIVYEAVKQNGDSLQFAIGFENDVVIQMLAAKMYLKLIYDDKMKSLTDLHFTFVN